MEDRVRIRDIAQELGLSTATVSNVIHGKTGKVSDETVRRVTALLEQRQYIPNMAGILLARNSSGIIGVFVNDHPKYEGHALEDFFISASLNALSAEIEAKDQFMMVKKAQSPEEIIQFSSMWNMEGIVVIGFCQQDYGVLRAHMRLPFVVYDGICDETQGIGNITIDNRDGGRQLGCHLRALGHSRAICLADNEEGVDLERMEGFALGFGPGEVRRLRIPMEKAARLAFYRAHLGELRQATALFAVSDFYAIELIGFLEAQGLSVPGDISVAGFDDTPVCRLTWPNLTTVRQDSTLRARAAMDMLEKLKAGEPTDFAVRLPVSLVVRDSTAAAK